MGQKFTQTLVFRGAVDTNRKCDRALFAPTRRARGCFRAWVVQGLSDTMYLLISFRKSTPLQNRQLNICISNSKQQVKIFLGGWLSQTNKETHAAR